MNDYSELDGYKDNNKAVIKAEIELYLYLEKYKNKLTYSKNIFMVKDTHIRIGGDNLFTLRMMKRRMGIQSKSDENDRCFKGYILLPYLPQTPEDKRYSVNSLRATVDGYNDNPFVFFKTLKEEYDNQFVVVNSDEDDKLKEAIRKTSAYWNLFGGYENYSEAFCIPEMSRFYEKKKYNCFFNKGILEKEKWNDYVELMNIFKEERIKLVNERIRRI